MKHFEETNSNNCFFRNNLVLLFYWVTDANILINKMFVTYLNVFILNFCFRISCSSQGHSEASSMWGSPKLILNVKQNHNVETAQANATLENVFLSNWETAMERSCLVKHPWPHLFFPDAVSFFLWSRLHYQMQEAQAESSRTLPCYAC